MVLRNAPVHPLVLLSWNQMAQNNYTVNLLSSSGSIVMSRRFYTFDKGRLDVSNVDSGIYFLQILLDNQVINRKIIIRK